MLCSDGLTDLVVDHDIAAIFLENEKVADVSAHLIQTALDAGGTDNVTVICVEMGDSLPAASILKRRKQRKALKDL